MYWPCIHILDARWHISLVRLSFFIASPSPTRPMWWANAEAWLSWQLVNCELSTHQCSHGDSRAPAAHQPVDRAVHTWGPSRWWGWEDSRSCPSLCSWNQDRFEWHLQSWDTIFMFRHEHCLPWEEVVFKYVGCEPHYYLGNVCEGSLSQVMVLRNKTKYTEWQMNVVILKYGHQSAKSNVWRVVNEFFITFNYKATKWWHWYW